MAEHRAGAALALVFNAFVWGVSWWPFRELQGAGWHPLWSTAGIYLFSLTVLLLLHPRALAHLRSQPALWALAAAAGLTNVGFNWAVTVGDVVRVVLLFYLMPAWSVLLAWPLLGERPTAGALARLVLALAGVVVILKAPGTPWPWPRTAADALALLGGFSFALTNLLLRRLHAVPAPARIASMFAGGTFAAAAAGGALLVQGHAAPPGALTAAGWGLALLLAAAFLLGNAALQYGASRLPAQVTALVMLSEVVFATVTSVLAGAAEFGPRTAAGAALIVAAAAWAAWAVPGEDAPARAQSAP